MLLNYKIKTYKKGPAKVKYRKGVQYKMFVRNCSFLTDKNDRSDQPSGQSGCVSGNDQKRKFDSRHVRTFALNHFQNLIL